MVVIEGKRRHAAYRLVNLRYRRLAGALLEAQARIGARIEDSAGAPWTGPAQQLLDEATRQFNRVRIDESWVLLSAARREALLGLDEPACEIEGHILRHEVEDKLTGWRQKAALDLLEVNAAAPSPGLLRGVVELLDGRHENEYNRLRLATTQLTVLLLSLVVAVVGITALVAFGKIDLLSPSGVDSSVWVALAVAAFGAIGAGLSELLPSRDERRRGRQIDALLRYRLAIARPIVGAAAAFAVLVVLTSGLTTLVDVTMPGLAVASVAAGFSERLLPNLLGRLQAKADDTADAEADDPSAVKPAVAGA